MKLNITELKGKGKDLKTEKQLIQNGWRVVWDSEWGEKDDERC